MQKQKINPTYLTLSSDYNSVSCGLYQNDILIKSFTEHKITASKNLMLNITQLLASTNTEWETLSFIGVNCGPGPFTTLRVLITTVNGLLCARSIPLIGIDGLQAFLYEATDTTHTVVALLNAFNNDIYFGIKDRSSLCTTGWEFHATFLHTLSKKISSEPIIFMGNGVTLHKELIINLFPHAIIKEPLSETVSLSTIAKLSLSVWHDNKATNIPLLPLYLKTIEYKQST